MCEPLGRRPAHNQESGRWETSIYRTDGLAGPAIWALGYQFVEHRPARHVRARGVGRVSMVPDPPLVLDPNGVPHPRHTDIIGWPNAGDKDAQMMLATEIANRMSLEIDPRPYSR